MAQRQHNVAQGALERRVQIVNALGLHARAAAKLVALAIQAKGPVRITSGDLQADATDILDVMSLGAAPGAWTRLSVTDPADIPVLEALAQLVAGGFGE